MRTRRKKRKGRKWKMCWKSKWRKWMKDEEEEELAAGKVEEQVKVEYEVENVE